MVQPVRRLVGELGDEELQDGSQVALAAHRHHLHWSGHGRVTVAATGKKKEREREILITQESKSLIIVSKHTKNIPVLRNTT